MISRRAFIVAVAGSLAVAPAVNGAQPGHFPVGQPSRLELLINLKTAKSTRLTVPPSLLARVDEVIR